MKNKGFTLVELIGVLVIMGMLLLIVFPATTRLMRDNENKKYDNYYDVVKASVDKYARTQRDSIGGINGEGCKESDTLSSLIQNGVVNKYDDEKITCKTPNEFDAATLSGFGIDTTKEYVSIRMENKKGIINTSISMICLKENRTKPIYVKLIEKKGICTTYVPEVLNSLIKKISDPGSTYFIDATTSTDGNSYVTGNPTNNYVWYSGKMWRIISYNKTNKTIKLVTDNNISIVTYNSVSNEYRDSNIYTWLNQNFERTLKNPEKYLIDTEWNYTALSQDQNTPPAKTNILTAKIGMLNNYEYNMTKSFVGKSKNFWLLSKASTGKAWYAGESNTLNEENVATFYGVRPSVVLRPNLTYISGIGTRDNPYRLIGDVPANGGTLLNTRYSGEYVKFYGINYRIVETTSDYTKMVAIDPLADPNEIGFHYYDNTYSDNTYIGEFLHGAWKTPIEDKITHGDFCRMPITNTSFQTIACINPDQNLINTSIAIPKIGDMFTIESSREYWTLTNSDNEKTKVYIVLPNGSVTTYETLVGLSAVRPVVVVKKDVKINTTNSGSGTVTSPYVIG